MGSLLSDTLFKSVTSKYVYLKVEVHDSNIALYTVFKIHRKGKDIRKKRHQIFKLPNFVW